MTPLDLINECIKELEKYRTALPEKYDNHFGMGQCTGITYAIGVLKGALVKEEINGQR